MRVSNRWLSGVWTKTSIVLLTAVWFGLGHYSVQGLAGPNSPGTDLGGYRATGIPTATGLIPAWCCLESADVRNVRMPMP